MLKAKDLRDQSNESLQENLDSLRREIFEMRGLKSDAQAQKPHLIGQKRKEVARILTILKEREGSV